MEISNILSRLMMGVNQLSDRNRGYEMTKYVLAILSPRLSAFGEIFKADGANMSWSSKVAAWYISAGNTGKISLFGFDFFFPVSKSKIPINYFLVMSTADSASPGLKTR